MLGIPFQTVQQRGEPGPSADRDDAKRFHYL
jgi:hypothetical protein